MYECMCACVHVRIFESRETVVVLRVKALKILLLMEYDCEKNSVEKVLLFFRLQAHDWPISRTDRLN